LIRISSECAHFIPTSQAAKVGESVTEIPNEYVFQYKDTKIVIIDTPGLLDTKDVGTRTHDKDKENVNNILRLLTSYKEFHAICILLKANETRLSDSFQYTLREILRRLDKSALNNIIFCYTCAGNMHFKPTDAQSVLEKFLKENKIPISLPLDKTTVYCFDNNSVKYLVERKNGIALEAYDKAYATINWNESKRSTAEMTRYLCSLNPFSLDGINAIYDAQFTIDKLSKLLLETLQCNADNVSELERLQKELEQAKAAGGTSPHLLENKHIERISLGYTNVVCVSRACATILKNGDVGYTQICCTNCKSLFMYFCRQMNIWADCKRCECGKSKHEWTNTKSEVVSDPEPIHPNEAGIAKCKNRLKSYKEETEKMLKTCAKLNTYMSQNALFAFGVDEMTRHLQIEIEIYESTGLANKAKQLKEIKRQYNEYLAKDKCNRRTPSDVHDLIQQLYELKINGDYLKKAMKVEEEAKHSAADVKGKTTGVWKLPFFS